MQSLVAPGPMTDVGTGIRATSRFISSPRGSSSGSRRGMCTAPLIDACHSPAQQRSVAARSTAVASQASLCCANTRGGLTRIPGRAPMLTSPPPMPMEGSGPIDWRLASCHTTNSSSSCSSTQKQLPISSRASSVCKAHTAGNMQSSRQQQAAAPVRSSAASDRSPQAANTAGDVAPQPASGTGGSGPSSCALPDDFWEERRKLLRSMRHERDPVNKRARFKAVREAEQARLAQMTPAQQAAYEEEMRALRIAGVAAQRAALDRALETGLRVVIDCEYAVPKQGVAQVDVLQQVPGGHQEGRLAQAIGSPMQVLAAGDGGAKGSTSSSSRRQTAAPADVTGPTQQQQGAQQPGKQQYPLLDVAWGDGGEHHDKEIRSLAKQIEASMSMNRRSSHPVALTVTSFCGPLASFAGHIGANSWPLNKHAAPLLEVFPAADCVFLSPDADEPLLELDPGKVYVIGGIVDRSVRKGLTLGKADRHGLTAVRLPVLEYAKYLNLDGPSASNRPVLNVSDVVVALVEFARTGDWVYALRAAVPARKQRSGGSSSSSSSQDHG